MREKLHQILRNYDPKDIFNCDETGLFWKMKPSRTISNGPVAGTKQSKDCVTILFTCNSTGTEKLRPLFIHKYENPRALKNINKKSLPVNYYWNKKSWMQVSIWNDYLKKLDSHMRVQNRHILLLVDNAPTHALYENTNLTNITIEYLPPNTTSHLQPCDQGIINSFKVSSKPYLLTVTVSYLTLIFFILVTI
jgi:DDE superfamily endonuclease